MKSTDQDIQVAPVGLDEGKTQARPSTECPALVCPSNPIRGAMLGFALGLLLWAPLIFGTLWLVLR